MNSKIRNDLVTPSMLSAILIALAGCSGKFMAATNSYDLAGEEVEIRMLTRDDFGDDGDVYPRNVGWKHDDPRIVAFTRCFAAAMQLSGPAAQGRATTESFAGIATGLLGVTIELIAGELQKDAERYEMQYRGITYNDSFWEGEDTPKYLGFELTRWTSSFTRDDKEPATRFVCLMTPSKSGGGQIFVLRPVYLEVRGTKVKLPCLGDDEFTTTLDIQLVGAVVGDGKLNEQILMTTKWKFGGLDLDDVGTLDGFHTFVTGPEDNPRYDEAFTAGWFIGVPLSEGIAGGPFKLAIAATETADTKAPKYLEQSATYLRGNKDRITKAIVEGNRGDFFD